MKTWLQRLLLICLRFLQRVLQWLKRPRRHRWARACTTTVPSKGWAQPKPAWVRQEIIRLKALMPEAGCRTIAHHFNRQFTVRRRMTVGKTYVADTLRRYHYLVWEVRRKVKHKMPRPVSRNLIWGCDLLVKTDQRGRSHVGLAILDHANRACLRLQRLPDKSSWRLLQELIQAVKRYGRPRFLRTDNEAVFASWRFQWGLRLLGITPQSIDPGCPWQNGRVERFIGTVKRALASDPIADEEGLRNALRNIRTWYNQDRPHDHLQGRTPAEVWAGLDVFSAPGHRWLWTDAWEPVWQDDYLDTA